MSMKSIPQKHLESIILVINVLRRFRMRNYGAPVRIYAFVHWFAHGFGWTGTEKNKHRLRFLKHSLKSQKMLPKQFV